MTDNVVVISLTTTRKGPLLAYLQAVVARGGTGVLIVGARGPWEPVPAGVTVVELLQLEQQMPWYRLLRFATVQLRAPRLRLQERLVRRAGTVVPGPRGSALTDQARTLRVRLRALDNPAVAMRGSLASPLLRMARPWLFWRTVRRQAPGLIDPAQITELVWGDRGSWPITWHLARQSPATVRAFHEL